MWKCACGGREGEKEAKKKKKKCCRVIFRLNVPLHNNLHKQPCVCDKKIGNFQRLCRDWELKASLCYLLSCSWSPQIPSLLSYISPKPRLINFLSLSLPPSFYHSAYSLSALIFTLCYPRPALSFRENRKINQVKREQKKL